MKFGYSSGLVRLLIDEHRSRLFQGAALLVGNSSVGVTASQVTAWARELEVPLRWKRANTGAAARQEPMLDAATDQTSTNGNELTERSLFSALGFDVVNTISPHLAGRGGLAHDLNRRIPKVLHHQYDLVVDAWAGAFHYHMPNFMLNLHEMLKVGGRVVHCLPTSGLIDLGFTMFSPGFFFDYYFVNHYDVDRCYLVDMRGGGDEEWDTYALTPGCLDPYLGQTDGALAVYVVATKTARSTGHVQPSPGASRALR